MLKSPGCSSKITLLHRDATRTNGAGAYSIMDRCFQMCLKSSYRSLTRSGERRTTKRSRYPVRCQRQRSSGGQQVTEGTFFAEGRERNSRRLSAGDTGAQPSKCRNSLLRSPRVKFDLNWRVVSPQKALNRFIIPRLTALWMKCRSRKSPFCYHSQGPLRHLFQVPAVPAQHFVRTNHVPLPSKQRQLVEQLDHT